MKAIAALRAMNETVTQRKLLTRVGGSFSTLTEILQRLSDYGLIVTPISRTRLLQSCLERRSEQVNALLVWVAQVTSLLIERGGDAPSLPEILEPARLGSALWLYPGADMREIVVLVDGDGHDEGRADSGDQPQRAHVEDLIWLSDEAEEVDGALSVVGCMWSDGLDVPSSATLAEHLKQALHPEWVSAPAVDTRHADRTSDGQHVVSSHCASMDTPTAKGTGGTSDSDPRDQRSVRRHGGGPGTRHADPTVSDGDQP